MALTDEDDVKVIKLSGLLALHTLYWQATVTSVVNGEWIL